MFKGVLIALGIMLGSWLVPIGHFILVPASPFLGGYFGINYARPEEGSYATKGLQFGAILGGIILLILLTAVLLAYLFTENIPSRYQTIMWIGVVVFTLYTGSMATMGAMYSALKARDKAQQQAAAAEAAE